MAASVPEGGGRREEMISQRDSWLALTVEEPLEPGMPICDPHHHFWDRDGDRYLQDEFTRDLAGGHNVAQTVFIECHSMYRARGRRSCAPWARSRRMMS